MRSLERFALVVGLIVLCFVGYYAIGLTTDPRQAISLRTPLDDAIPFVPESIWIYASVYVAMLFPAFVVQSRALFRRVVVAYAIVVAVSLAGFVLVPVSSLEFRPDFTGVEPTRFVEWGLKTNFALDPPVNLFPSLHLGATTVAALAALRAHPKVGRLALLALAAIAVSICTVKQHYWLDGAAGLAVGAGAWWLGSRGYHAAADPEPLASPSWRGPLAFVALYVAIFASLYLAYRLGVEPWELVELSSGT